MLKILFGLLLAINGGLIAFQQGWLDTLLPASREPSRMTQQLHPEQLTLVALSENRPATTPLPAGVPAAPSATVSEPSAAAAASCTEVGNFDAAEAQRFESRLASLSLGERLTRRTVPDNTRHIVYIPPLASKEAAEKKAAELRQFGIEDFFVIQDNSPLQWGISLGVFKTDEAARNHLAALNKKGVRSAKVGLGGNRVAFQMRGIDAATKNSLDKIREDFPRQQLRDCA
ncbi:MAG TPA: SPOR domain-containing protein [Oxalicibacterium sp.]|uniref:SPOR domain-containing protein n=1 Tax=Oxalicibacterium sp. TaxID=2766525 RepID=UPI002B7D06AC|nr:SPOR domain-containing protein [Oxalicibacterium sp.]HWU99365.1 SPOR domain-containing protein [Oxalicibacterium sp.]